MKIAAALALLCAVLLAPSVLLGQDPVPEGTRVIRASAPRTPPSEADLPTVREALGAEQVRILALRIRRGGAP